MKKIFLMIAGLVISYLPLSAKIVVRELDPLCTDQIVFYPSYTTNEHNEFYGQITIHSKTDDIHVFYTVPVYKITIKPSLKDDVQFIFFNEMTFENDDTIRLVNGLNEVFLFNINTYEVKCISGKTNCKTVQKSFESAQKKDFDDLAEKYPYSKPQPEKKRIESVKDFLERVEPVLFETFGKEKIMSEQFFVIYQTKDLWQMVGKLNNGDSTATNDDGFEIAVDTKTGKILYLRQSLPWESAPYFDYTRKTRTEHFFLGGNKAKNTITCVDNDFFLERWQIPRYWPNEGLRVQLSNDGVFCVLDNRDEYLEEPFEKKDVLFWVYKNGLLYDTITREKYLTELEKILGPDIKINDNVEVEVNDIYINGLRLDTYYYEKDDDYDGYSYEHVNEIFLWYDFDTKKFLNSNKLRADQCKIAFDVLAKKFPDAEKLIDNKEHKKISHSAFEKIMPFAKDAPTDTTYRRIVRTYADGDFTVQSILPDNKFEGMAALEKFVYSEEKTRIEFFILDDIYDFAIRIQKGSEWEIEYQTVPTLIYMFDTKRGIVLIDGNL